MKEKLKAENKLKLRNYHKKIMQQILSKNWVSKQK